MESDASALARVLVAEDEALIRMDLVEMLREEGYDVVADVGDGERAVEQAVLLQPDVVLLDVKMPVLDGLGAAERLRDEGVGPVVMITAFSQREVVDRASDAGVMGYLVKPFQRSDLRPTLEVARARWRERRGLMEEAAALAERLAARVIIDRAKAVLMRSGCTEQEAFRTLQRSAMDQRRSMAEVAAVIVEHSGDSWD
jgi:AmiR/NasT family two-component response regulator